MHTHRTHFNFHVFLFRRDEILELVDARWEWMRRPIHIVAATLHPLYKAPNLFQDATLVALRYQFVDQIISLEGNDVSLLLDQELNNYENSIGAAFQRPNVADKGATKWPLNWWQTYGWSMPHLRKLALRVLSQVSNVHKEVLS